MENQRNFLTIGLVAISAILYFKWMEFSAQQHALNEAESAQASTLSELPTAPEKSTNSIANTPSSQGVPAVPELKPQTVAADLITVETDMIVARINPLGGVIESLELKKEPVSLDQPDQGFALLKNNSSEVFIVQDGIVSNFDAPSHLTPYSTGQNSYDLGGAENVVVPLTWVSDDGIKVTKTITFTQNSYVVDINYNVENNSQSDWSGALYAQFNRSKPENTGGGFGRLPSYTGAAVYTQEEKRKKYDFGDLEDLQETAVNGVRGLNIQTDDGWIAMLQHYFVGALIPTNGSRKVYSSVAGRDKKQYRIGYRDAEAQQVLPGQTGEFKTRYYLGSKEQSRLKRLEKEGVDGLALTVDYGWLTFLADPLFTALSWLHKLVGNWGWAIILLTIVIKLLFYPLSAASYRSMGKMRKLQPRMQTLKERYKDDRQKFQMEMMALYKKEKVNPAGGCLPMLIQIPVFIALYWVLLESVEMRQAPFALWWQDLSAKDPYYVLPVLMGVSMYLMQKLNPAPMDDIQKKVFMIMPFALTFLFMTFPQGLVLYWVVNNVLTMAQQWFNYKQQEKAS